MSMSWLSLILSSPASLPAQVVRAPTLPVAEALPTVLRSRPMAGLPVPSK
jgi:hypothetical protein